MTVEWYALTPGLKFRRNDDGKIIMRLGGEQTYISADKWAAFVDGLSGKKKPATETSAQATEKRQGAA